MFYLYSFSGLTKVTTVKEQLHKDQDNKRGYDYNIFVEVEGQMSVQ